uniref:Glycoprotein vOX2-4 n=1 Tax=Elephant endotheliotropic herpesvirus 1A TaxID=759753 RepID=A0A1L3HNZ2_ELHV1|nr:glycoprotein vOX2-4 [Elephant endotheliotropic herpesvirus 1A]APG41567.2 glycoprotein vOX2-4 [Elephant endotheliotropic herpesvirus 1A]AYC62717.1 glycoprotein vOX2-4 [Elephant endotheliotropic herpesvirus 1A]AYC62782.1 glycoprotein vOX2-4 [Elephant endotheliotropic herpesvirus 1A]
MCLGGGPYVETKSHQLAILNTNVTLECALKNSYDSIFIITWHKNGTNGRTNVGTTGNQFHEEKVPVTTVTHDNNMKRSGLNILNTTKNDSCCFICSFYCNKASNCSTFSNTTCLTIYASVETNISSSSDKHGKLNVTCLAKALPPASNVTWIGLSNIDNSTSITNNTDGTLTVRSTLHIADEKRQVNGSAYCRVSHQVSVTYLAAPWNSEDDMGIFGLIMEELDLSDSYELVFNDGDDGGEDDEYDDDDEGEDYEEDK